MPPRPPTRHAVSIDTALTENQTLQQLSQRLHDSRTCFELIAAMLPPSLHAQLRPGPIDNDTWTLLAPNSAVSAKLRHSLPALEAGLQQAGQPARVIRVRILSGL